MWQKPWVSTKYATKLLAFAMGALFSGLEVVPYLQPRLVRFILRAFSFIVSINILSLIIIGGMGSIPGVFVGGLALVGLPLLLSQFADFRYLIYGAALVAMMLIKGQKVWHRKHAVAWSFTKRQKKMPYEEPTPVLETTGQLGGY